MIKHYFKLAASMLRENKLTSIVSILGTALSVAMILVVVLQFQIKLVGFPPESNRSRMLYIYGIKVDKNDHTRQDNTSLSAGAVAECLYTLRLPEAVTAMTTGEQPLSLPNKRMYDEYSIRYTDASFWHVYDFGFLAGVPFTQADFRSALPRAVVALPLARKLFGSAEAAIGKRFLLNYVEYTITGVVDKPSEAADGTVADVWIPYSASSFMDDSNCEGIEGDFGAVVLARSSHDFDAINRELQHQVARYNAGKKDYRLTFIRLFSRLDVARDAGNIYSSDKEGWNDYLLRKAPLLLFLLLVPALNLTGIVQSSIQRRRSEMGIRKAFGATKGKLMMQLLNENLLITLIGGVIGIVLSVVMLYLGRSFLLEKDVVLTFDMLFKPWLFLAALFFTLLLNLLSAGLPALRVSREQIVDALHEDESDK